MLATATSRNDYVGAGSVGPFPYNFKIWAASDLRVIKRNAIGTEAVLNYPADFSVTGVGKPAGGIVTLTTALAVGENVTVRRVRPLTQTTDLRNQSTYFREDTEDALDKLTMAIQQHEDSLNRSIRIKESYAPGTYTTDLSPGAAGQVVGWGVGGLTNMTIGTSNGVAIPGNGRVVATFSEYINNNAVVNSKDYASVQAAIDNLPANGGYVVIPPELVIYGVDLSIVKNNVKLVGFGRHHRADDTQASTLYYTGANYAINVTGGQGFHLDSVRIFTTQASAGGVRATNVSGGKISGCRFSGVGWATSTGKAILIDDGSIWQFDDCVISGYQYGLDLTQNNGLSTCRLVSFLNNTIGARIGNTNRSAAVNFDACDFEGHRVAGLDIVDCLSCHVHSSYFEDTLNSAVSIRIGAVAGKVPVLVVIDGGCYFSGFIAAVRTGENGIQLNRCGSLIIRDISFGGYVFQFIKNNGTGTNVFVWQDCVPFDGTNTIIDFSAGITKMIVRTNRTVAPTLATDPGVKGEVFFDTSFVYYCTATNTWKRAALATW